MSVKGESKARSGDKADYKEYRTIKNDKTYVFFIEDWHGGLTDQLKVSGFVCLMYIDGEIRLLKQRVKRFVMQLAEKNGHDWV